MQWVKEPTLIATMLPRTPLVYVQTFFVQWMYHVLVWLKVPLEPKLIKTNLHFKAKIEHSLEDILFAHIGVIAWKTVFLVIYI